MTFFVLCELVYTAFIARSTPPRSHQKAVSPAKSSAYPILSHLPPLHLFFLLPHYLPSFLNELKWALLLVGKGGYFPRQVKVYTRVAMLSADCFRWQERQFFTGGAHTQGKPEERIFPPSCLSFTVFSSSFGQTHKWKNLVVLFLFFRHTKEKTGNGVVKPRLLSSSNKGKHDVT